MMTPRAAAKAAAKRSSSYRRSMTNENHSILRGLGIVVCFYSGGVYRSFLLSPISPAGIPKSLSLFSGDGVGVLQIDGAIDDSRSVLIELKRLKEMPWVKADRRAHRLAGRSRGADPGDLRRNSDDRKSKSRLSPRWAAWRPRAATISRPRATRSSPIPAR